MYMHRFSSIDDFYKWIKEGFYDFDLITIEKNNKISFIDF